MAVWFVLLVVVPPTPVTADEVDEDSLIQFNVPEQRVDLALTQYAEQASITLLFPSDAVGDVMANRLVGEYSVSEGVEILLAGTDLIPTFKNKLVLNIVLDPERSNGETIVKKPRSILARIGAVIAGAVVSSSGASAEVAAAADNPPIEEIVVTGVRGSLRQSLDMKRNSDNFVDAINAEDIGAFPDQNLAEALQRISGVAIERTAGEGNFATIRGLGPQFVLVTSNGRGLAPNTRELSGVGHPRANNNGSRAVSFNRFGSDLVQSVEVYKTPQANMLEGGLGGVINVNTRRPIDIGKRVASVSAEVIDNVLADETGESYSAIYSDVFADKTFGFMLGVSVDSYSGREDEIDIYDYAEFTLDTNGDTTPETAFYPDNVRGAVYLEEHERLNLSGAFQWRPAERIDVNVDVLYTNFETDDFVTRAPLRNMAFFTNDPLPEVELTNDGATSIATYLDTPRAQPRLQALEQPREAEGIDMGANVEFRVSDRFTLAFDAALSRHELDVEEFGAWYDIPNVDFSYDARGGRFNPVFTNEDVLNEISLANNFRVPYAVVDMVSEDLQIKVDGSYQLDGQIFESIEFGVAYRDMSRDEFRKNSFSNAFAGDPLSAIGSSPFPVSDFLTGVSTSFPTNWVVPNLAAARQRFLVDSDAITNAIANAPGQRASDTKLGEEVLAGYVMMNLAGSIGDTPYTGNIGVRVVDTQQDAVGVIQEVEGFVSVPGGTSNSLIFGPPTTVNIDNDYTEILPSINLRFETREDLVLRASVAKVMSRPGFSQLNPGGTGNASLRVITSGNPNLDAIVAWQADFAVEWYFAEYSILSISPFGKWVDTFVVDAVTQQTIPGTIDPDTGVDVVLSVRQPVNEDAGFIGGVEVNYQQQFAFLPSPFDGLGVQFNYTYVTTDAEFINAASGAGYDIPGLSEDTFNIVAFYEKGPIASRLAFNRRGEFLNDISGPRGNPSFMREFDSLDFSLKYHVNDNLTVRLEGINLLDENQVMHYAVGNSELFGFENNTGRRYTLGATYRF